MYLYSISESAAAFNTVIILQLNDLYWKTF